MTFLFSGCSKIKCLPDLSKWKLPNVSDIHEMFYGCSS